MSLSCTLEYLLEELINLIQTDLFVIFIHGNPFNNAQFQPLSCLYWNLQSRTEISKSIIEHVKVDHKLLQ